MSKISSKSASYIQCVNFLFTCFFFCPSYISYKLSFIPGLPSEIESASLAFAKSGKEENKKLLL